MAGTELGQISGRDFQKVVSVVRNSAGDLVTESERTSTMVTQVTRTVAAGVTEVDPTTVRKTTNNGTSYTNYTTEATDDDAATHVALSSLDTLANGDWLIVGAALPFRGLGIDMDAAVNGTASVLAVHYWNGTAWTAVAGLTDGTAAAGATFAVDGNITWTPPTDWVANTVDGVLAYHVRLTVSVALDASCDVDAIVTLQGTLLVAANTSRQGLIITNNGATVCYLGLDTNVVSGAAAATNGGAYLGASGGSLTLEGLHGWTGVIYAVTATGTTVVSILEW